MLPKEYPDHYDATLILQLYDLRRESVMREARAAITRFRPATAEEAVAVLKHDHPLNTALRQVVGYWEMVYGMMKWGILHAEFALESTGEGLVVFAKLEPFLEQIRAQKTGVQFLNTEWVATQTEAGRRTMERLRPRYAPGTAAR
ncbi:MAG: hypothetical protein HUU26_02065 [Gemmatimonadaceae bacterium]|nr:hypothetical protein [Gemmatimonadaceae bacterium]